MNIDALRQQLREAREERDLLDAFIRAVEPILAVREQKRDSLTPPLPSPLAASPTAASGVPSAPPKKRAPRTQKKVAARGETERAVLAVLGRGGEWTPAEVAEITSRPKGSVANVLSRLRKAGTIHSPGTGRYTRDVGGLAGSPREGVDNAAANGPALATHDTVGEAGRAL